jgi:uncharacterized protein YbjT (DUF2867 family)
MYVITGATGNVGGRIADILLSTSQQIRVTGRNPQRLDPLAKRGAEAFPGDMADPEFLTRAFTGAKAVFTMIPPNLKAENLREYQNKITESIVTAIKNAGVTHVVNLSSIGANLTDHTGPVLGLHDQEERLNQIPGLNVVHIRAGYFMENLYGNIDMIKKGAFGTAMKGDLKVPFIATRDIASAAAKILMYLDFTGSSVRELLGERDISLDEIAKIIGKAIRTPRVKYSQFSYGNTIKALVGMGMSRDVAQSFVDLSKAANEGILYRGIRRTPESTTGTSFEEFAKSFAAVIRKAA